MVMVEVGLVVMVEESLPGLPQGVVGSLEVAAQTVVVVVVMVVVMVVVTGVVRVVVMVVVVVTVVANSPPKLLEVAMGFPVVGVTQVV